MIHLDLKPSNIFVAGDGKFRIGDFGMATLWPRQNGIEAGFEREGDREYMAPEVLQGIYGKAADVFRCVVAVQKCLRALMGRTSFGMIMLETAGNIVVPDMCVYYDVESQLASDLDCGGISQGGAVAQAAPRRFLRR